MKLILILHKVFCCCCCCFLLLHNIKAKLLKTLEKPGSSQLVPSCLHSLTAHTATPIFHFHQHWAERSQCLDSSPPQLLFLLPSDIFSLPPFHWACSLSTVYGASSTKSLVSLEVRMDIVALLHPLSILQPSMPWSLVWADFSPYCVWGKGCVYPHVFILQQGYLACCLDVSRVLNICCLCLELRHS